MKSMFRSNIVLSIIAFLSIGCSKQDNTFRIGYIPIAECLQLYVAKDLGFFESENLNVSLIPLQGGALILKGLTANELDVGFSNVVSLALHCAQGSQFCSIFGATYESPRYQNHALVARFDLIADSPSDLLKNKIIAVNTLMNIESLMIQKYLASEYGLEKDKDYTLVEQPFPRMLPLIASKQIDAACIVEPFIKQAQDDTSSRILLNHYLGSSDKTLVATYVTSKTVINAKSDQIAKFRRAMAKATLYIQENEGKSRETIPNYTKIPAELAIKIGLSDFQCAINLSSFQEVVSDMIKFKYFGAYKPTEVHSMVENVGN